METEDFMKAIASINIIMQLYYGIKLLIEYYFNINKIGKYGRLSYPQNVSNKFFMLSSSVWHVALRMMLEPFQQSLAKG